MPSTVGFVPKSFRDVIVNVPVPAVVDVILSTSSVAELISIKILPLPVILPIVCDVIAPSDIVTAPLFMFKVPTTPPPLLRTNDVLTTVVPFPLTCLLSMPERFKVPLFTIADTFSAFVVVVPAFVNVPFTVPLLLKVPRVTVIPPLIIV